VGLCRRFGEMGNAYTILVGKFEAKRLVGVPRRRLLDNIEVCHKDRV
jgi:hypothetical protein